MLLVQACRLHDTNSVTGWMYSCMLSWVAGCAPTCLAHFSSISLAVGKGMYKFVGLSRIEISVCKQRFVTCVVC